MTVFPNVAFGDIALVPGPMLKAPKGIWGGGMVHEYRHPF